MSGTEPPEPLDPRALVAGRLQLHYALQPLTALAVSLLPKAPDWSHGALSFDPGRMAFRGRSLPTGLRGALVLEGLELRIVDASDAVLDRQGLFGRDLNSATGFVKNAVAARGLDVTGFHAQAFADFPAHPLASGAHFDAKEQATILELGRFFALTALALVQIRGRESRAGEVRVWPHHCDMATLITVRSPSAPGGEDGVSVGVGFSPGDTNTPEPYWYVTPWPYPDPATLPALPKGRWNTTGWVGAVLEASLLSKEVDAQAEEVNVFLATVLKALL